MLILTCFRLLPVLFFFNRSKGDDEAEDEECAQNGTHPSPATDEDGPDQDGSSPTSRHKRQRRHHGHRRRTNTLSDEELMRRPHRPFVKIARGHIHAAARRLPLFAAIMAPLSTLYDIPALTQSWLGSSQSTQPDAAGELALSSVELFFNIVANFALILRFSTLDPRRARWVTRVSTILWIVKTIIAIVNLAIFSADTNQYSASDYQEGFWCAVVSCIISGSCAQCLVLHWLCGYDDEDAAHPQRRAQDLMDGRAFMLSVVFMCASLGIMALVFSKLEGWLYFDGVYFSVVSATTIGFGDLHATTTVSRILLFPFLIIVIVALAYQISLIIGFIQDSLEKRKARWRDAFEARRRRLHEHHNPEADLQKEIEFIEAVRRKEQLVLYLRDLAFSLTLFLVFFLVGAVIFHALEGWSYGIGLYFCYAVFLTVGWGDYTPTTPAGRVVFVIYALLSVPVITSFAVQTICQVFVAVAENQREQRKDKVFSRASTTRESGLADAIPHADHVDAQHHWITNTLEQRRRSIPEPIKGTLSEDKVEELEDSYLTDHLIQLVMQLQREARIIMMSKMSEGDKAYTLLKADWHVAQRDIKALGEEAAVLDRFMPRPGHEEFIKGLDTLEQVKHYRATFGAFLATASEIKHLTGAPRLMFERKRRLFSEGVREDDRVVRTLTRFSDRPVDRPISEEPEAMDRGSPGGRRAGTR